MIVKTFSGVERRLVDDLRSQAQKAVVVRLDDNAKPGDVVRFVSDERDPGKRLDVFRVATHRRAYSDVALVSLRPLSRFEKRELLGAAA